MGQSCAEPLASSDPHKLPYLCQISHSHHPPHYHPPSQLAILTRADIIILYISLLVGGATAQRPAARLPLEEVRHAGEVFEDVEGEDAVLHLRVLNRHLEPRPHKDEVLMQLISTMHTAERRAINIKLQDRMPYVTKIETILNHEIRC